MNAQKSLKRSEMSEHCEGFSKTNVLVQRSCSTSTTLNARRALFEQLQDSDVHEGESEATSQVQKRRRPTLQDSECEDQQIDKPAKKKNKKSKNKKAKK